jgi:hypothetical protein
VGAIFMPLFADPEVVYSHKCLKSTQVLLRIFFEKVEKKYFGSWQ